MLLDCLRSRRQAGPTRRQYDELDEKESADHRPHVPSSPADSSRLLVHVHDCTHAGPTYRLSVQSQGVSAFSPTKKGARTTFECVSIDGTRAEVHLELTVDGIPRQTRSAPETASAGASDGETRLIIPLGSAAPCPVSRVFLGRLFRLGASRDEPLRWTPARVVPAQVGGNPSGPASGRWRARPHLPLPDLARSTSCSSLQSIQRAGWPPSLPRPR